MSTQDPTDGEAMFVETEFKREKVFWQQSFPRQFMEDPQFRTEDSNVVENMLVGSVESYIARRLLERVEVQWPADWWQHFKERWSPEWALRRWPVRYEQRTLEAHEWLKLRELPPSKSGVYVQVEQ